MGRFSGRISDRSEIRTGGFAGRPVRKSYWEQSGIRTGEPVRKSYRYRNKTNKRNFETAAGDRCCVGDEAVNRGGVRPEDRGMVGWQSLAGGNQEPDRLASRTGADPEQAGDASQGHRGKLAPTGKSSDIRTFQNAGRHIRVCLLRRLCGEQGRAAC